MREGNWKCEKCNNINYSFRTKCNRQNCGADKPSESNSPSEPADENDQVCCMLSLLCMLVCCLKMLLLFLSICGRITILRSIKVKRLICIGLSIASTTLFVYRALVNNAAVFSCSVIWCVYVLHFINTRLSNVPVSTRDV